MNIRRYVRLGVSLLGIGLMFWFFGDIVSWMIIAWVLSLMGQSVMRLLGYIRFKKWQLGLIPRAVLTIITFYGIFVTFLLLMVPPMINQASKLAKVDYAQFSQKVGNIFDEATHRLEEIGIWPTPVKASIDSMANYRHTQENAQVTAIYVDSLLSASGDRTTRTNIVLNIQLDPTTGAATASKHGILETDTPGEKVKKQLYSFVSPTRIMGFFSGLLGLLGNFSVAIASITFMLFFFLKDEELFVNIINGLVPERRESSVDVVLERIKKLLSRYFLGLLLEVAAVTLGVWAGLTILGVPNALLLAFLSAILNIIPYLGPILGALFGTIITITANLDADFYAVTVPLIFRVLMVSWVMQMLDNYFLQPYIFSKSVHAHPLEIFLVIIIGAKFAGIAGMVLAVPVYTVLRVIAAEFLIEFRVVQKLTEQINKELD